MNRNISSSAGFAAYFPMLIVSFITAIVSSCILSPIYTQISSDIVLMYTVLPIVVDYLIIVFDIIYISILFAIISCSAYSYLKNEEKKYIGFGLASAVIVVKHILNLTVSSIIDNYIDVTFDIPLTFILIMLDIVTLFIVRAIAIKKSTRHLAHAKRMQKAAKYLDNVIYDESAEIFPFGSPLNIKNPIIAPIFIGTVITLAILILQRLYADFIVIGLPSSFYEIIEIAIAYISDLFLGIIGYIAAYYAAVYTFIKRKNNKI